MKSSCEQPHFIWKKHSQINTMTTRTTNGCGHSWHVVPVDLVPSRKNPPAEPTSCSRGFRSVGSSWNNMESERFGNKAVRREQTSFFVARNQYVKWIRYSWNWRGRVSTSSRKTWVSETCWFACETSCASHFDVGPWAYRWHLWELQEVLFLVMLLKVCNNVHSSPMIRVYNLRVFHGASFSFAFAWFCWLV